MVNSSDQNNASKTLAGLGISAPPSGTTKTHYLGVPDGYKPPTIGTVPPFEGMHPGPGVPGTPFGTVVNPDPYTETDKWGPAADVGSIATIQAEMVAAGLLNKTDVRPGVWDAASADAYGKVLGFANQQGLNATDALTILTSNPPLGRDKRGAVGPTISFTNPEDVQSGYQNVSQALTGQEQDPSQFQQHYHDLEAAQAHKTGQNYTQAPSLTGAATQYVQNNLAGQEASYGVASRMNDFFSMLHGSAP